MQRLALVSALLLLAGCRSEVEQNDSVARNVARAPLVPAISQQAQQEPASESDDDVAGDNPSEPVGHYSYTYTLAADAVLTAQEGLRKLCENNRPRCRLAELRHMPATGDRVESSIAFDLEPSAVGGFYDEVKSTLAGSNGTLRSFTMRRQEPDNQPQQEAADQGGSTADDSQRQGQQPAISGKGPGSQPAPQATPTRPSPPNAQGGNQANAVPTRPTLDRFEVTFVGPEATFGERANAAAQTFLWSLKGVVLFLLPLLLWTLVLIGLGLAYRFIRTRSRKDQAATQEP